MVGEGWLNLLEPRDVFNLSQKERCVPKEPIASPEAEEAAEMALRREATAGESFISLVNYHGSYCISSLNNTL